MAINLSLEVLQSQKKGGPTQLFEPPRLCTQSPMFFGKFKRFSLFKLLETGFSI